MEQALFAPFGPFPPSQSFNCTGQVGDITTQDSCDPSVTYRASLEDG